MIKSVHTYSFPYFFLTFTYRIHRIVWCHFASCELLQTIKYVQDCKDLETRFFFILGGGGGITQCNRLRATIVFLRGVTRCNRLRATRDFWGCHTMQ